MGIGHGRERYGDSKSNIFLATDSVLRAKLQQVRYMKTCLYIYIYILLVNWTSHCDPTTTSSYRDHYVHPVYSLGDFYLNGFTSIW